MKTLAQSGPDVAVIILTYNEEANVGMALGSVCGWAREVFVLDSFSKDDTVAVAERFDCGVVQHEFENFSAQRNWALDELSISSGWVLFLDADERLTQALKDEIDSVLSRNPKEVGFLLKRRFYWNAKWIRRGYYPTAILRLFRRGMGRCEEREINEHIVVTGPLRTLNNDFIHEDHKGLADWTKKHVVYAQKEALQLLRENRSNDLPGNLWGTQSQRVRWIRLNVYNRLPPIVRPCLYFFYRVVIRLGFVDGWQALVYHFLQAFWCPLLIDLFYLELRSAQSNPANNAMKEKKVNTT